MSSITGRIFKVTTFGESHGASVGAVIDGCPSLMELSESDIQQQLDRRRPGQSDLTTSRGEKDRVRILSGVESGVTLGTPIALVVDNEDQNPSDYSETASAPRPSHSDYTYRLKYGVSASSGGGRASARETIGRVAAGAVAEKYISTLHGTEIIAWVSSVGEVDAGNIDLEQVSRADVDVAPVRCPDSSAAEAMTGIIKAAAAEGDSLGGVISCICRNVPAGLGEPVFDKVGAVLGHAMLSIPAVKGFEIGSGFAGSRMCGSEHNDMYVAKEGPDGETRLGTVTNRSGGMQGGITNGESIFFKVAFKPTSSIRKPQNTVDYDGNEIVFELKKGRHDPCVLPRAVPVVESMAALVLADLMLVAGK